MNLNLEIPHPESIHKIKTNPPFRIRSLFLIGHGSENVHQAKL